MAPCLFQDLRILFTFLSEKEKSSLVQICRDEGAVVLVSPKPNDPPHVIVTRRVGSPKYCAVLKRHARTPVVSPEWIENCMKVRRRIPYSQYAVGPCYGLKICLSGFNSQDKSALIRLIQEHGGTHSPSLTKQCTHLVAASSDSEKYVFARRHKIPCISKAWLRESVQSGWCKEESHYPVLTKEKPHSIVTGSLSGPISIKKVSAQENQKSSEVKEFHGNLYSNPDHPQHDDSSNSKLASQSRETRNAMHPQQTNPMPDELHTPDENTTFLDVCNIWAVGCTVDEQFETSKLCCSSGAKRFAAPHPTLITHILVGSKMSSVDAQEVLKYVDCRPQVPMVKLEWLRRSVGRQVPLPTDQRFMVEKSDLLAETAILGPDALRAETSRLASHSIPNDVSLTAGHLIQRNDGVFAGCYFTLVALKGSAGEGEAEALVRQNGGKIFNSSLPVSSSSGRRAIAICPASLTPLQANRLKSMHTDFACVTEANRYTLYWLKCCAEAGRLLTAQKGSPCFRPFPFALPLEGMEDVIVAMSGYNPSIRNAIKHTVETLGGSVTMDFMSSKNTHLLVPTAHGEKFKHSQRLGVIPVTADWLVDSIACGRLQAEINYRPRPLPGEAPERMMESGLDESKIDSTQHAWGRSQTICSKGLIVHSAEMDSKLSKNEDLAVERKKKKPQKKFVMPPLPGIVTQTQPVGIKTTGPMDPGVQDSNVYEGNGHVEKRPQTSGTKEILASDPEQQREGSLDEVFKNISSVLRRVNSVKRNENMDSLSVDDLDRASAPIRRVRRRTERKSSRAPNQSGSTNRSAQLQHHENLDGFEISQRVGYETSMTGLTQEDAPGMQSVGKEGMKDICLRPQQQLCKALDDTK